MNELGTAALHKSKTARHENFLPCRPHKNTTKMLEYTGPACCCCRKPMHLQQKQKRVPGPGNVAQCWEYRTGTAVQTHISIHCSCCGFTNPSTEGGQHVLVISQSCSNHSRKNNGDIWHGSRTIASLHRKCFQNHHLYSSMTQLPSCDKNNFLCELSFVNIHVCFDYARLKYHHKVGV